MSFYIFDTECHEKIVCLCNESISSMHFISVFNLLLWIFSRIYKSRDNNEPPCTHHQALTIINGCLIFTVIFSPSLTVLF